MRKLASSCLAACLAVALGPAASAAPPERMSGEFTGTEPFYECTALGYDFDIFVDYITRKRATIWRNADGNITRIQAHGNGRGTIYPVNDPTDRITGSGPTNVTIDFEAQTYRISGQEARNVAKGQGRVAHVSGTQVIPIIVTDPVTGDFIFAGDPSHVGGPHPDPDDIAWCQLFD